MKFFGFLAAIGAVLGALILVVGVSGAKGAPQEASAAAIAMAVAVLPYVLFRVLQLLKQAGDIAAIRKLLTEEAESKKTAM